MTRMALVSHTRLSTTAQWVVRCTMSAAGQLQGSAGRRRERDLHAQIAADVTAGIVGGCSDAGELTVAAWGAPVRCGGGRWWLSEEPV